MKTCHICHANDEMDDVKLYKCCNCGELTCPECSSDVNIRRCEACDGITREYHENDRAMNDIVKHIGFKNLEQVEELWGRNIYAITVRSYDGDYIDVIVHYDIARNGDTDYIYADGKLTKEANLNLAYYDEQNYSFKNLKSVLDDLKVDIEDGEESKARSHQLELCANLLEIIDKLQAKYGKNEVM